jgi:hypothetical protein
MSRYRQLLDYVGAYASPVPEARKGFPFRMDIPP